MSNISALRAIREQRGETVSSMAKKLRIGVSRYYMIESGDRPATPQIADDIARILEVEPGDIFLPHSFTVRQTFIPAASLEMTGTEKRRPRAGGP